MTFSKIIPGTLVAGAILFSGLTMATGQTAPEIVSSQAAATDRAPDGMRVDYRKGAGDRGGRGLFGQMMEQVDVNADGAVTQVEIDTFRAGLVERADASGDGDISLQEFETIYMELTRERMVDAFQALDPDGNGVVTQAEMDRRFGNIVDRMDRNDDGQLTREDRGHRHSKGERPEGPRHGDKRG
jgi:hypothetical protein